MRTTFLLVLATALFPYQGIFAQCSLSSSAPPNIPVSISNVFSSGDEGFSGDFTWEVADENLVTTMPAPGIKSLVTPLYYTTDDADIVLQFDMTTLSDAEINGYKVYAQTATNSAIQICNVVLSSVISATSPTQYFITVPAGYVPIKTPFKLMISFDISGSARAGMAIDNFATNIESLPGTLPVKFGWFRANRKGSYVNLEWKSEVEENTRNYVVERSVDGKNFKTIGTVSAEGSGTYYFADKNPLIEAYYRIKAIDLDYKFNYSTIAKIKGKEGANVSKAFWRQRDILVVQHEVSSPGASIQLISTEGRIIATAPVTVNSGETVLSIPYAGQGMIIVRLISTTQNTEIAKVIRN